MTPESSWESLTELVAEETPEAIERFLAGLPAEERALAVSRLAEASRERLLRTIPAADAAELVECLPEPQAVEALESLETENAARILEELPSDQAADLVHGLKAERAEAILEDVAPREREGIRALTRYDDDTAGGLMQGEFLAYDVETPVGDVIADLQAGAERYARFDVQYVYVTDCAGRLTGVLFLRSLLLTPAWRTIDSVCQIDPHHVHVGASVDELRSIFDVHAFQALPVVDEHHHLLGVLRRDRVEERIGALNGRDYRLSQGIVGGEELRTMPTGLRARRRLSWLSVNVVLNVFAAAVIAANEEIIGQVLALAVFLPILSDMSGCSGNQAVAVTMRELSLGVVRPSEAARVALKEAGVGLINGTGLGILVGAAAWGYSGNPWLGLVVGSALLINTVLAVIVGGVVPLALKRFGFDPALASGPLLTTVTDMCGFFLVLSFAAAALPHLI